MSELMKRQETIPAEDELIGDINSSPGACLHYVCSIESNLFQFVHRLDTIGDEVLAYARPCSKTLFDASQELLVLYGSGQFDWSTIHRIFNPWIQQCIRAVRIISKYGRHGNLDMFNIFVVNGANSILAEGSSSIRISGFVQSQNVRLHYAGEENDTTADMGAIFKIFNERFGIPIDGEMSLQTLLVRPYINIRHMVGSEYITKNEEFEFIPEHAVRSILLDSKSMEWIANVHASRLDRTEKIPMIFRKETGVVVYHEIPQQLGDLLHENRMFNIEDVNIFFRQLIGTLADLEELGLAHGDICPRSILIRNRRILDWKLGNFKYSMDTESAMLHPTKNAFQGVIYPPPETVLYDVQLNGLHDHCVFDVWGLGMLYLVLNRASFNYTKELKKNGMTVNEFQSYMNNKLDDRRARIDVSFAKKLLVVNPYARPSLVDLKNHPQIIIEPTRRHTRGRVTDPGDSGGGPGGGGPRGGDPDEGPTPRRDDYKIEDPKEDGFPEIESPKREEGKHSKNGDKSMSSATSSIPQPGKSVNLASTFPENPGKKEWHLNRPPSPSSVKQEPVAAPASRRKRNPTKTGSNIPFESTRKGEHTQTVDDDIEVEDVETDPDFLFRPTSSMDPKPGNPKNTFSSDLGQTTKQKKTVKFSDDPDPSILKSRTKQQPSVKSTMEKSVPQPVMDYDIVKANMEKFYKTLENFPKVSTVFDEFVDGAIHLLEHLSERMKHGEIDPQKFAYRAHRTMAMFGRMLVAYNIMRDHINRVQIEMYSLLPLPSDTVEYNERRVADKENRLKVDKWLNELYGFGYIRVCDMLNWPMYDNENADDKEMVDKGCVNAYAVIEEFMRIFMGGSYKSPFLPSNVAASRVVDETGYYTENMKQIVIKYDIRENFGACFDLLVSIPLDSIFSWYVMDLARFVGFRFKDFLDRTSFPTETEIAEVSEIAILVRKKLDYFKTLCNVLDGKDGNVASFALAQRMYASNTPTDAKKNFDRARQVAQGGNYIPAWFGNENGPDVVDEREFKWASFERKWFKEMKRIYGKTPMPFRYPFEFRMSEKIQGARELNADEIILPNPGVSLIPGMKPIEMAGNKNTTEVKIEILGIFVKKFNVVSHAYESTIISIGKNGDPESKKTNGLTKLADCVLDMPSPVELGKFRVKKNETWQGKFDKSIMKLINDGDIVARDVVSKRSPGVRTDTNIKQALRNVKAKTPT